MGMGGTTGSGMVLTGISKTILSSNAWLLRVSSHPVS